jgi:uncharacterized protein YndB with AHSA1/START domain
MTEATQAGIHTASVAQEIQASRDRLWRFVVEPQRMERWLCDTARVDLRIGGRYDFAGPSVYGWREGEETGHPIVGYDAGERVTFEWNFMTRGGVDTRSRVNLHVDPGSAPGRSRIAVEHEIEFPRASLATAFRAVWSMAFHHLLFDVEGSGPGLRYDFTRRARGSLTHSIRIGGPAARCFQAVATLEGIRATFTRARVFEPRLGGLVDFGWPEEAAGSIRVREYDAPRRVAYDWPAHDGERAHVGRVTWTAEPAGRETVLTVVQDGFPEDFNVEGEDLGWAGTVNEIKKWVETGRPSTYLASRLDGQETDW